MCVWVMEYGTVIHFHGSRWSWVHIKSTSSQSHPKVDQLLGFLKLRDLYSVHSPSGRNFKESHCYRHLDVFIVWESRAWSLDPHERFVWRSDAWRWKGADRVASRRDWLGRVPLGEVQVGTLIEEDWGPWEAEVWGLYGLSLFSFCPSHLQGYELPVPLSELPTPGLGIYRVCR